jgi:junctophilin
MILIKNNCIFFRTATARGKAEQADIAAMHARDDGKTAVGCAKEYAGDLVPVSQSIAKAAEGRKFVLFILFHLILFYFI